MFGDETLLACERLDAPAAAGTAVDLEAFFGSLALTIIGNAVFNYRFGEENQPIVNAALSTLREAEHRATTPFPYWKIPFAMQVVPRQRKFLEDMALLDKTLEKLIQEALASREEGEMEDLMARDYSKIANPSLLRVLDAHLGGLRARPAAGLACS